MWLWKINLSKPLAPHFNAEACSHWYCWGFVLTMHISGPIYCIHCLAQKRHLWTHLLKVLPSPNSSIGWELTYNTWPLRNISDPNYALRTALFGEERAFVYLCCTWWGNSGLQMCVDKEPLSQDCGVQPFPRLWSPKVLFWFLKMLFILTHFRWRWVEDADKICF